jgi:nuclear transport factor 2 (NTF2) superfamily protein
MGKIQDERSSAGVCGTRVTVQMTFEVVYDDDGNWLEAYYNGKDVTDFCDMNDVF